MPHLMALFAFIRAPLNSLRIVVARNSMHKEAAQPSMAIHERVEALQDRPPLRAH